jgi:hypothetical protein
MMARNIGKDRRDTAVRGNDKRIWREDIERWYE